VQRRLARTAVLKVNSNISRTTSESRSDIVPYTSASSDILTIRYSKNGNHTPSENSRSSIDRDYAATLGRRLESPERSSSESSVNLRSISPAKSTQPITQSEIREAAYYIRYAEAIYGIIKSISISSPYFC
jgi:hypothetical protein